MAVLAAVSDKSIARLNRAIGMINLALAFTCMATPSISSYVGDGMALLLVVCLLAGATLMFVVARCFDPRPQAADAAPSHSSWQLGSRGLITAA